MSAEKSNVVQGKYRGTREVLNLVWALFCLVLLGGFVTAYAMSERQKLPTPSAGTTALEALGADSQLSDDDIFQFAQRALDAGAIAEAEAYLASLQGREGNENRIRFLEGAILMRRDRVQEAMARLSTVSKSPELEARTLALVGEGLMKLERFRDAESALQRAVQLDSSLVSAHRWLSILYNDLGAMDAAVQHLKQVGTLAPQDPRPFRLMGRINKDYERFALAVDDYKECLRRDPLQPEREQIVSELASVHMHLRQYPEALELLATLPVSAETLASEGECYRNLGDTQKATDKLNEALKRDPKHLTALMKLSEIAVSKEDLATATELLRQAVDAHPLEDTARYQLGFIYRRQGKETEAEQLIKASQELREKRTKLHELHLEAIERPYDAELRFKMAQEFVDFKFPETAKQWLRATLILNPKHEGARKLYAELDKDRK